MKTLQIIKDDYAKSKGFKDYYSMIGRIIDTYGISSAVDRLDEITEDLLILVQQEQQKVIAENAKIEIKVQSVSEPAIFKEYGNEYGLIKVNEQSIINDEKIII